MNFSEAESKEDDKEGDGNNPDTSQDRSKQRFYCYRVYRTSYSSSCSYFNSRIFCHSFGSRFIENNTYFHHVENLFNPPLYLLNYFLTSSSNLYPRFAFPCVPVFWTKKTSSFFTTALKAINKTRIGL